MGDIAIALLAAYGLVSLACALLVLIVIVTVPDAIDSMWRRYFGRAFSPRYVVVLLLAAAILWPDVIYRACREGVADDE